MGRVSDTESRNVPQRLLPQGSKTSVIQDCLQVDSVSLEPQQRVKYPVLPWLEADRSIQNAYTDTVAALRSGGCVHMGGIAQ